MARVYPFILKRQNIKPHTSYGAWVELENSAEKQSTRASIDRALQIYTINLEVHSIPTLHINTL